MDAGFGDLGYVVLGFIIYFIALRQLVKKDAFDSIDGLFVVLVLLIGFVPFFNIVTTIGLYIGYLIANNDLAAEDIIKKILFIK